MTPDILEALEEAMGDAARLLARRIKEGTASAADISRAVELYQKAGGTFTFAGKPTASGDAILESMADVDPSLVN